MDPHPVLGFYSYHREKYQLYPFSGKQEPRIPLIDPSPPTIRRCHLLPSLSGSSTSGSPRRRATKPKISASHRTDNCFRHASSAMMRATSSMVPWVPGGLENGMTMLSRRSTAPCGNNRRPCPGYGVLGSWTICCPPYRRCRLRPAGENLTVSEPISRSKMRPNRPG